MEIVCPVCATPEAKCVEITDQIMVCHCDECDSTFTIQMSAATAAAVRHMPPGRRGGTDSSPSS